MGDSQLKAQPRSEPERLRQADKLLRARLDLLSQLSSRFASSLDLPVVLQHVVDAASELVGTRYGAVGLFDASGRIRHFITHGISSDERERLGGPPQGLGILGWLHELKGPARLADLSQHPRSVGFPPSHPEMKTLLAVPIRHGDESLGNVYLAEKANGEEFTREDEQLLALLVDLAAVPIGDAQRLRRERTAPIRARPAIYGDQRAEKALGDSDEHFRLLVDGVSDYGILMLDPEGIVVSWSRAAERIKGYRAEEIIGQHFSCFYPREDIERGKPAKQLEAAAMEGRLEDEGLRVRKNGSRFWANVVIAALRNEAGDLRGFAEVTRDITRRKLAETATEGERRRLETLVETSPVGIIFADTSGRLVLVNREAERIVNFSYKQGDKLETLDQGAVRRRSDGTDYAPDELPIRRALYQGETVRAEEVWFHFPDGRTIPTLVNAAPICGAWGQVTGAAVIVQDITPLEELEKLRAEFMGVVSHELKTPLTAIKGSAAMALGRQGPLDAAKARELFEIIDEQADRLGGLVDNLLDMTRIEAGSLSVRPEPTDLRAVLEEARAIFTRGGNLHEVEIQVPEDLPVVNADRARVAQVLSNLLSNAAKFSPQAEQITVTVEREAFHATVRVHDRGRGIPAEKLSHLFKKFSQVHEDQGRGLGGSGLGLAICKGIVEAHGGRIQAESPGEGRGSTFSFTLPIAADGSVASGVEAAWETVHAGRVSRAGGRPRILALDDEPQVLRYLRRALHEAGYQPVVTSDPREVPKLVELGEPELILLDLMLPGVSGFEVLQRVREVSSVPVIVVTASHREEDAVRALKMGADDYIRKPFSPSELVARIEAALRRRLPSDATESRAPLVLDDLTINFVERRVVVGGQGISLSATQYRLLYELAIHAGRVLTHDQILQRVWGANYSGEAGLLRSFIRDVRRKLGDDARRPRYILTEPQVGYRMRKPQS